MQAVSQRGGSTELDIVIVIVLPTLSIPKLDLRLFGIFALFLSALSRQVEILRWKQKLENKT